MSNENDLTKTLEAKPVLRVFQMNDRDWYCGYDLESAVRQYQAEIGETDPDNTEGARELTDDELSRLVFWDTEDREETSYHHWQCPECGALADGGCRWNGYAYEHPHACPLGHVEMINIHRRTFAQELERHREPGFFATTEC